MHLVHVVCTGTVHTYFSWVLVCTEYALSMHCVCTVFSLFILSIDRLVHKCIKKYIKKGWGYHNLKTNALHR